MAQYKAFLSYNHAIDARLAPMLQSALRRIGKPWYRLPFRVFRDKSTMSPPVLWPAIEDALSRSEYFLLLASAESAQSPWVSKEIEWWLGHRRLDHFIIILTGGDIAWDGKAEDFDWTRSTALNPCLREQFKQEPLYIDLRWARTERNLSPGHIRFHEAILDIGSTLRGMPRDALHDEDVRHSRLARRLAGMAIIGLTALSLATGIAAYVARVARLAEQVERERAEQSAVEARDQRDTAEIRRREAEDARQREAEQRDVAVAAAAEATQQREVAIAQRDLALCRQLASQSLSQLDQRLDLALLLAVEARQIYTCAEISNALLAALHHQPRLNGFLWTPTSNELPASVSSSNMATDVAFSRDGRMLAASSWLGGQLWNPATRRPISPPLEANYGLAFTSDGKTLIASDGERVRFWDTSTGLVQGEPLEGYPSTVTSIELSPDGALLASGADPTGLAPAQVYLWDFAARRPSGAPLPGNRHAFSPDGKTLATTDEDFRAIVLWDVQTRTPLHSPLEGHTEAIRALAFSPDGTLLASGGADNLVIVWDMESRTGQRLTGHTAPVNDLAFSHDGRFLVSGGGDRRAILWDTETLRPVGAPLAAASGPVFGVAFSPDDRMLASTSGDERVILWNLDTDLQLGQAFPVPRTSGGSNIAFSKDGQSVAFVDNFANIVLWDLKAGQAKARFGNRVTAVDISSDGKLLAAVSRDGFLSIWDVSTSQPFGSSFELGDERFWSVRFSPDDRTIAVGGDSVLVLWDVQTRRVIGAPRREQKDRIWSLSFSPNAGELVSGGNESLRLWRIKDGWTSEEIPTPFGGLSRTDVAFSPDGKLLAFRGENRSVAIWDLALWQPVRHALTRNRGNVSSLAFSPDGDILVVGGSDGTIMLWDVATGELLGRPLSGHDEAEVQAVAFGPDGRTLVSIGAEKMIIWDFRTDNWTQTGCRIANRSLTPAEWTRYFGGAPYRPTCRS